MLYRGLSLTMKSIDYYISLVGSKHKEDVYDENYEGEKILVHKKGRPRYMGLFGFISTSTDRRSALSFAKRN